MSLLRIELAARALQQGGIVAYPTEAVWGLGCDPLNGHATADLLALKGRSESKGLILIAADLNQIEPFVAIPSADIRAKLLATWPGPVTWILPAAIGTPAALRGKHDTLAVRVTAHPLVAALCRSFGGAVVSTSANPSGLPPARNLLKTRCYFAGAPLHYLAGNTGGLERPTAIYDAKTGNRLR